MVYRAPWVDQEGRRLDEAEISAFRASLRAKRRLGVARVAVLVAAAAVAAIALASAPRAPEEIVFTRKAGCAYDGCFCWSGSGDLVQTACAPPDERECLPIAPRCAP